jgi:nucleoside-diphosphate-sugar epimerase
MDTLPDKEVLEDLARQKCTIATGKVLIKSDGTPWRPIVHVEDIFGAFIAAPEAPRDALHAQAFNVGRPEGNYRVRELAEIVRDAVPGCELEFAGDASPDTRASGTPACTFITARHEENLRRPTRLLS